MQGVDCLTFRDRLLTVSKGEFDDAKAQAARVGQSFDEELFKEWATAYISVEAWLPVLATHGKEALTCKFLPAPTQMQIVPAEIDLLVKMEERRQEDLARVPARS